MPIRTQAGMENAQEILKQLDIERVPQEIFELKEAVEQEEPNLVTVAQIISRHPKLLGQFLSIANQVLRRDPDNLILDAHAAVNLLGLDEIEKVFLASYLEKQLPRSEYNIELIKQNKRAALVAAEISYWINDLSRAEAYLVTFLQDVGALYMARHFGLDYLGSFTYPQLEKPYSAHIEEVQKYQTSHAFLGSLISSRWKLGHLLSKSILLHHSHDLHKLIDYDRRIAHMVALIHIANAIVYQEIDLKEGLEEDETPPSLPAELEESLTQGIEILQLPDNALKAARSALEKWGMSGCDHFASH